MTVSVKAPNSGMDKNDEKIAGLSSRRRKALQFRERIQTINSGKLPSVGDKVSGKVKSSGRHGILVSLPGRLTARVKLSEVSTRFISGEEVAKLYPPKTKLEEMTVSEVSADGAIELKLKGRIGQPEIGSIHKAVVRRVEKYGALMGFPNSLIRCLCETEQVDDDESNCRATLSRMQPGHKYSVKVIRIDNGKIWVTMKQSELGAEGANPASYCQQEMEFSVDEPECPPPPPIELIEQDSFLFTIDGEPSVEVVSKKRTIDDALEGDSEGGESVPADKKKLKKREKQSKRAEKEAAIREKESALVSGQWKRDPQTCEEFDRLILAEGTRSAAVWIKYMSYWLKMTEFGKAREVCERALKQASLSFSDEREKFNLWIAYLNMEAAFGGNPEAVFERAAQFCDTKKIHHALPQVYVRAGQFDKAQVAFERMVAKFPTCRKAWLNMIEFQWSQNFTDAARSTFERGLKALPTHKKIRFSVKFAQMEFKNGNPDRGSSVFEKLVHQYSQKTDIWSVYFDETIKAYHSGHPEVVRELFEKSIATKLKPFKMKFFFKRYLDFEQKHGSDASVELVKNKAIAYVESIDRPPN